MFAASDTAWAPWFVAHSDDKKRARLNIITHLLGQVPYDAAEADRTSSCRNASRRGNYQEPAAAAPIHPDPVLNPAGRHVSGGNAAVERWVPGVRVARTYRREWLRSDVVAGLVLAAILVPQGMAYAELAGLPAVTGLYTTIACLVGYAIFGPSRVLVLGPTRRSPR